MLFGERGIAQLAKMAQNDTMDQMIQKQKDIDLPIQGVIISVSGLPKTTKNRLLIQSKPQDMFPDFKKGYSGFGFNNGSFCFGDVIEYVLNHIGPAHAMLSTWVAGSKAMRRVVRYLENEKFLSCRFLIDQMLPSTRPEIYEYIIENFGADCVRTSRVHAKFCALWNDDWSVVIETSANLNKNLRLESFRITEDEEFLHFFRELFDHLFSVFPIKYKHEDAAKSSRRELKKIQNINSEQKTAEKDMESEDDFSLDLDLDF